MYGPWSKSYYPMINLWTVLFSIFIHMVNGLMSNANIIDAAVCLNTVCILFDLYFISSPTLIFLITKMNFICHQIWIVFFDHQINVFWSPAKITSFLNTKIKFSFWPLTRFFWPLNYFLTDPKFLNTNFKNTNFLKYVFATFYQNINQHGWSLGIKQFELKSHIGRLICEWFGLHVIV